MQRILQSNVSIVEVLHGGNTESTMKMLQMLQEVAQGSLGAVGIHWTHLPLVAQQPSWYGSPSMPSDSSKIPLWSCSLGSFLSKLGMR